MGMIAGGPEYALAGEPPFRQYEDPGMQNIFLSEPNTK